MPRTSNEARNRFLVPTAPWVPGETRDPPPPPAHPSPHEAGDAVAPRPRRPPGQPKSGAQRWEVRGAARGWGRRGQLAPHMLIGGSRPLVWAEGFADWVAASPHSSRLVLHLRLSGAGRREVRGAR